MKTDTTAAQAGADVRMQGYFYELADYLQTRLTGEEVFLANFNAEDSDFARFNRAQIRQAGHVTQRSVGIDLIVGNRVTAGSLTLSGEPASDRPLLDGLLGELRDRLPHLPEDPHLLYSKEVRSTDQRGSNLLPEAAPTLASVLDQAKGLEFVGIWASGGIYSGFANSLGQRNWFSSYTYNLDWSIYHTTDKAVKCSYAGFEWKPEEFTRKLEQARVELAILGREAKTIQPGRYRVYLSPVALQEIVGMLSWGGLGLKSHRTKQTTLIKMIEEGAKLHPAITLCENTKEGVSENFQGAGFLKPDRVVMIENGAFHDCLVSPRSAKEYGVPTNGASGYEAPESVELAGGDVPQAEVLSRLGTGIYINNLWYLNFSDRTTCRMTGMTRFACFWVEDGKITAPLNVMRFDETLYRVLGECLIGLTKEREMLLDSSTYYRRSTGSARLPGALVEGFTFTL
jgi:predicted Zn-dependent protease